MRVLIVLPPMVPSYFNAGHHLPIFQVAAYIRKNVPDAKVTCIDGAALNLTWRDLCAPLASRPDVICVMNDLDGIDAFPRFMRYARELAPDARTITFGRLSGYVPRFFERYGFDAIAFGGDYEAAVTASLRPACGAEIPGVALREDGVYRHTPGGLALNAEDWVFPDIGEIPYGAYERLYLEDLNKFCGIPARRELVVPIARGCPINCAYCDVPKLQGRKERRVAVDSVLDYIEQSASSFEYVSFYAPTFTLNRNWVLQFCAAKRRRGIAIPWKCVTTLDTLDTSLVEEMAAAGCVRVSIGLETLDPVASRGLPKTKQHAELAMRGIAADCARAGIELNCFVMLGMPGDSAEGMRYTVDAVLDTGARLRPTVYTPYHLLRDDMSELEVSGLNRQLVAGGLDDIDRAALYRLIYQNARDVPTTTTLKIPARRAASPMEFPRATVHALAKRA